MIDFDAPAEGEAARHLIRLVRSRPPRAGGPSTELTVESNGQASTVEERVALLKVVIQRSLEASRPEDRPDAALAGEVVRGARSGLTKAARGDEGLTQRDVIGLEAVVLTGGSRPSLTVREGFVDLEAPDIGGWAVALQAHQVAIRGVIASVGRVNIPTSQGFAGTCFVVAPGLVATNRHVLEEIAVEQAPGQWTLNWPTATTIDFVGEGEAATATQVPVSDVAFAGPDAINHVVAFTKLDLAVLRVEAAAAGFPAPVRLETDLDAVGSTRDLYVGFPGRPETFFGTSTPPSGTETTGVLASIFKWKFGVKKLAPGRVLAAPGALSNDTKRWVFSHDASTLRGHSGSCVADLGIDGARVFGIHFGGVSRDKNWGHAFAALRQTLAQLGVAYV